MSENYEDLLDRSFNEIPKPKTLPGGSWRLKGRNASILEPKEAGKSRQVMFVYTATEPMEDVDDDALSALGEGYDYGLKPIFVRFWLQEGADYDNLRKHLAKHGIDVETDTPVKEILKEQFRGTEILATLDTRSFVNSVGDEQEENTASNFTPVN